MIVAGWKPGDPIPSVSAVPSEADGARVRDKPAERPEQRVQPKPPAAFDFILNPDWEAVEDDFSDDESE